MTPARIWNLTLYFVIAALPALANLLLTFVLVRGLGIEGFATWSILEPLLLILSVVGTLGTSFAVLFFVARGEVDHRRVLGNGFLIALPPSVLTGIVAGFIAHAVEPSISPGSLVLPLIADAMALQIISTLRSMRRLTTWASFEIVRSLGLVGAAFAAYFFAPRWISSTDAVLLMRATLTFGAVAVATALIGVRLAPDRALMMRMMRYGIPASTNSTLGVVINNADRFLLAGLGANAAVIASYAAHQRLTGLLGIATIQPLNLWYPVEAIRRDAENEPQFFQGVLVAVSSGLVLVMVAASLIAPMLWPWLFPQIAFHPLLFALLSVAIVPRALSVVFNVGGLREKKVHWNLITTGVTGATIGLLGVPLIQSLAGTGAALARALSLSAQTVITATVSQRIAPIAYRFAAMTPMIGGLAASMVVPARPWSVQSFVAALGAVALVGLGLFLNRGALGHLLRENAAA